MWTTNTVTAAACSLRGVCCKCKGNKQRPCLCRLTVNTLNKPAKTMKQRQRAQQTAASQQRPNHCLSTDPETTIFFSFSRASQTLKPYVVISIIIIILVLLLLLSFYIIITDNNGIIIFIIVIVFIIYLLFVFEFYTSEIFYGSLFITSF